MMTKPPTKDSTPKDDGAKAQQTALPMVLPEQPAATPQTEQAPEPLDADPLAKWRAAREMEEDMNELFDEDRVTHKHGNTEPEAD
ncbi:MAG: hypothetical protein HY207_08520 [Nitrospirae bacterium]|nr:hypothetical protein [Nitrospirota bacterium]